MCDGRMVQPSLLVGAAGTTGKPSAHGQMHSGRRFYLSRSRLRSDLGGYFEIAMREGAQSNSDKSSLDPWILLGDRLKSVKIIYLRNLLVINAPSNNILFGYYDFWWQQAAVTIMIDCAAQTPYKPPSSILVIGAGIFGR